MKTRERIYLATAMGLFLSAPAPSSAGGNFQHLQSLIAQQALESGENAKQPGLKDNKAQEKEREKQTKQQEEKKRTPTAYQPNDTIRIGSGPRAGTSYSLDPEAGKLRFGDGTRGRRLPGASASPSDERTQP